MSDTDPPAKNVSPQPGAEQPSQQPGPYQSGSHQAGSPPPAQQPPAQQRPAPQPAQQHPSPQPAQQHPAQQPAQQQPAQQQAQQHPAPQPAQQQPPGYPPTANRPAREGGFKRGFGMGSGLALGAGLVALVVGAVMSGVFVAGLAAISSATAPDPAGERKTVWGEPSAAHTVLAIPVTGPILGEGAGSPPLFGQGTYGYDVAARLDSLETEDADAVILSMDTPGGTIYGSRAISDAVERYQKRTSNPVVAYVRGTSASGGMYAMAGADQIIVDHGTIVGSIGVIMGPLARYRDVTAVEGGLLGGGVTADGGITEEYLSRGKGKDFGNPYRDITPEERQVMDTWLDSEYQDFVDHVATRRDIPPATIVDTYGAYIFGPKQAIENKLADAELGQEEAYQRVAELAEVDPKDTKVQVDVTQGDFLTSLLLGRSGAAQSGGAGRLEAEQLTAEQLKQGRAALAASGLCSGSPAVVAVHGDPGAICD